jgi:acetyltransferase
MIEVIDYELILGAKKDKDFGSVILFGMGGITAELIRDFSIGLPPLNQTLVKRLIEETKAYRLMQGWRGKPPADLEALEETIINFSNLVVEFPEIAEIDINPLCISNGKPYALDGRIILDKGWVDAAQYQHLVIMPYPSNYIIPWEFSDGTNVLLRPIRPEDEPLEHELLSSLSPESLRTRFFSPNIDISHEKLILFCNIDYDRHIAMVGEIMENGKRKIIGVARLIINSDFNSAEFAVLVHDNYQGKRLGYKLMEVLIDIGREKGLYEIYGEVLTDNKKMLSFCKKLGFTAQGRPGGTTTVTLRLR